MTDTAHTRISWRQTWAGRHPWAWIPSAFLAKGLTMVVITTLSLIAFKRLGLDNATITLYVSCLYLPWMLKPLFTPLVRMVLTRRLWMLLTELLIAAALAALAFVTPAKDPVASMLILLGVMSLGSALHDTASDSLFRVAASPRIRSSYGGISSVFYRLALLVGQGALVMVAGNVETLTRDVPGAWSLLFRLLAGFYLLLFVANLLLLPHRVDVGDKRRVRFADYWQRVNEPVVSFFHRSDWWRVALFTGLFILPEALAGKVSTLFLLDAGHAGGLGLSPQEYGFVMGTIGVFALAIGGYLGGKAVHRRGVGYWRWYMVAAFTLTNAFYLLLAYLMPSSLFVISLCVFLRQLASAFGLTYYVIALLYLSRNDEGDVRPANLSVLVALAMVSLMVAGWVSGTLQEMFGYKAFFKGVLCTSVFTFAVAWLMHVNPLAGKRERRRR